MTEQNAPWIESDGVINLPTAPGIYEMRNLEHSGGRFCFFDGNHFHSYVNKPDAASAHSPQTTAFSDRLIDAWRDYQGLMSKPAKKTFDMTSLIGWKSNPFVTPTIGIDWSSDAPIMASEEPGIQRAAYAAKYEAKQETIPETIVLGSDRGQVSLTFNADGTISATIVKTPAPNNTPRGIMTVWNERADHRLGQWNQGAME